jgi:hypothetical protein
LSPTQIWRHISLPISQKTAFRIGQTAAML